MKKGKKMRGSGLEFGLRRSILPAVRAVKEFEFK
jgi:hypothetical protein